MSNDKSRRVYMDINDPAIKELMDMAVRFADRTMADTVAMAALHEMYDKAILSGPDELIREFTAYGYFCALAQVEDALND
jgi:hypothetical protein